MNPLPLVREFAVLVAGGLTGSALGAGFGALVGVVSPEFLNLLAQPMTVADPVRVGAASGMVCGLLLGTAAMTAGRFLAAVRHVADRLPAAGRR